MKKTMFTIMLMASASLGSYAQTGTGIDLANLNQTVRPGDDFYQYACGGWMKNNPLPAAYSRFGSFDQLQEDNNKRINDILSELQRGTYKEGTVERKLSDFYRLAMDSVRRNKEGVAPLMPLINEMESAKTVEALQQIIMKYADFGFGVPMRVGFGADEKNASMNILSISQGGLVLGQKEYYLDNDKATADIRNAYKKHIVRMFQLFGFSKKEATKKMNLILDYETELAKVSKSRTELRDPEANYNKMTLRDFQQRYPNIPLVVYQTSQGVKEKDLQEMIVGQPAFLDGANKLIANHSAEQLRAYMEWDAILGASGYLSDKVNAANFDFFGKTMRGRQEDYPRWKRATNQVEAVMGEALGKMYCERYFPESSKTRMKTLVRNLQVALAERILAQTWMDTDTKLAALAKLSTFYVKIGYPDKWKDMSGLTIDPEKSYLENVNACRKFWNRDEIERTAGKPVDINQWFMTPQTVNAYYNPTTNEICFPAGILQRPFFDPQADDAFNYGAIGVVIGHEMTHGFDDQGRRFDKNGNMTDWWTEDDGKRFVERTDRYADFFSAIKVLPDLNANGRLTLGENLADHGGLQVAWYGYKNATRNNPLPTVDGLTADQRFFLAYAGVWGQNITEKEIRNRTKSDPHSLGEWRVNGALPHIDMWYEAFGIKEGDKMFIPKSERLELW
ncbi:MAG: M13 family metallopeptidase [Prevotella sp.]|nr:M13 family metallopeptidase [Prevotella sp.]